MNAKVLSSEGCFWNLAKIFIPQNCHSRKSDLCGNCPLNLCCLESWNTQDFREIYKGNTSRLREGLFHPVHVMFYCIEYIKAFILWSKSFGCCFELMDTSVIIFEITQRHHHSSFIEINTQEKNQKDGVVKMLKWKMDVACAIDVSCVTWSLLLFWCWVTLPLTNKSRLSPFPAMPRYWLLEAKAFSGQKTWRLLHALRLLCQDRQHNLVALLVICHEGSVYFFRKCPKQGQVLEVRKRHWNGVKEKETILWVKINQTKDV